MSEEGGMNTPPRIMESVVFTMPGEDLTPQKVLTNRSNHTTTPRVSTWNDKREFPIAPSYTHGYPPPTT